MFASEQLERELDAFVARLDRRWESVPTDGASPSGIERRRLGMVDGAGIAGVLDEVFGATTAAAALVLELGPGADLAQVRQWLTDAGAGPALVGWTPPADGRARTAIAVVPNPALPTAEPAPAGFRVLAIMCAYNEVDIIRPSIERLLDQGIDVHLIDNWSFDGTREAVADLDGVEVEGRGRLVIERFPEGGRPDAYEWTELLGHVAKIAAASDHDWCIHHDVDQRRESPFPGQSYVDLLWLAQRWGFNAVDHTLLEFRPTDDGFVNGTEPSRHLRHFEFMSSSVSGTHIQAWRNGLGTVELRESGGHEASFPGRRVFPLNATLRHYPIRGQRHGDLKVFRDRKPRYVVSEMDRGWHWHYARLRSGHDFIRPASELIEWNSATFAEDYFVPRLSQRGIWIPPEAQMSSARSRTLKLLRRSGLLPRYVRIRNRINRFRST